MDFQQIVAAFQGKFPELTETQAANLASKMLRHIGEHLEAGDALSLIKRDEGSGMIELTIVLDPNEPPPE